MHISIKVLINVHLLVNELYNTTLFANACMYYISRGGSIPNYVCFGLRKKFQETKSYVTQKLPVYTTPLETLVIITP
jgi:uncharacterized membrane protein